MKDFLSYISRNGTVIAFALIVSAGFAMIEYAPTEYRITWVVVASAILLVLFIADKAVGAKKY